MKTTLTQTALFALVSLASTGLAQDATDILADAAGFKAKITFSDVYADKIQAISDGVPGDPLTHQANPTEHLTASITARLGADFNFATEIADAMAVEVSVGAFDFSGALGDSVPLDHLGKPKFAFEDGKHSAATFPLTTAVLAADGSQVLDANGNPKQKTIGSVKFSWSTKTRLLTVTVTVSDAVSAALGDIDTASHIGENDDGVIGGHGPIAPEAVTVLVNFGSATGTRNATATGLSRTSHSHFGSDAAGTLEDVPVNTVTVTGKLTTLF